MFHDYLFNKSKKRRRKAEKRLQAKTEEHKKYRSRYRALRRELSESRKQRAALEDGYVVEWCIHCERQVVMLWDVKEDGLAAFCPYCGSPMMLCEKCQGECDYSYGFDTCKEM